MGYKTPEATMSLQYAAQVAVNMGMIDSVAAYISKGYTLNFSKLGVSEFQVSFVAFMESFSDSYSSNFVQENAFGRTDPIPYYQNTTRTISLSWALVADNIESARRNLTDVNTLVQMLYPSYTKHGSQRVFSAAPLISLKYINLVNDDGSDLAGTIGNFTHTPDLDFGVFENQPNVGTVKSGNGTAIFPKVLRLTCDFFPIHQQTLGFDHGQENWEGNTSISPSSFPYGGTGRPGTSRTTTFDSNYFKGYKSSEGDEKIDPAYAKVLQAREKEILDRSSKSSNPWSESYDNFKKIFDSED
tara:strand:- start:2751 stop:3650 length:900 start_codon:yes stop_codon:yes gene_type:complete